MRTRQRLLALATTGVLIAGCSSSTASSAPATQAASSAPAATATAAPTTAASAASTAPSATAAAATGAWQQSDIFKDFDPLKVDLTGFTPGPNGEQSTNAADVPEPSAQCLAQVKGKKVAFLNGLSGNSWMAAIEKGVREKAAAYGLTIAATASTDFDPAKEAAAVETVMASKPDILITIPVDPASGAADYKPAVDAGVTLSFYDNPVTGYTAGKEYVAITTGDHYRMGKNAADLLAQALGGKGKYGFIQLDVVFYNSNNREKGFLAEMAQKYPDMQNVAWAGFTSDSTVGAATDAMLTQHPDLDGIYVSYSGGPATAVLASLQAAGNTHIKVVTHDLDAANDVIMATKDSNYYGTAIESTYDEGAGTVKAAVLKLCGETVPPFIVVPALAVNRDNLAQAWADAWHQTPPAEVTKALGQ
ncbi:MAG: substrate-binding domain-containing protein [Chloroflexota bacterium]